MADISRVMVGRYETADQPPALDTLVRIADALGVSTDYLLGMTETKNHPNTELHELGLSDGMIELLKSGKINNRLLCEIATHPDFQRLMVDTEICVDRIAAMRVHDMNVVLAEARKTVMEKHNPGENDLYMRTLELAQIDEDEYFSQIVYNDLAGIIRDIREAHKKDSTTADAVNPSDTARQERSYMLRGQSRRAPSPPVL